MSARADFVVDNRYLISLASSEMGMTCAQAGRKGGKRRLETLSSERRSEIARKAQRASVAARLRNAKQKRCQASKNQSEA